jgi:hypothetical protein
MGRAEQVPQSGRAAALGLAVTGGMLVLAGWTAQLTWTGLGSVGHGNPVEVDAGVLVLVSAVSTVCAGACAWAALVGALAVMPRRAGHPHARVPAPGWAPRAAAVLLAVSLATPATGAAATGQTTVQVMASASATRAASVPDAPRESTQVPVPGWTPPAAPVPAHAPDLVSRGSAPDRTVVVRGGDTLWSIAAHHLGPDATAEEIAAAWPRWHEANRGVIGDDPDLVLPGQQLVAPGPQGDLR